MYQDEGLSVICFASAALGELNKFIYLSQYNFHHGIKDFC
jgi:hypothetical protein